jgi:hypothetical protein
MSLQIWRHIQTRGNTSAEVFTELRNGTGLVNFRLDFDADNLLSVERGSTKSSLDRAPTYNSPSRFSLSRRRVTGAEAE